MLDIVAMILIVVEENLPFGILWSPWSDLMYALMFWFVFLLVVYCLFFCFMCGRAWFWSCARAGAGGVLHRRWRGAAPVGACVRCLTRARRARRRGWYCEIPLISEGVYIQIEQAESMGA